MLLLVFPKIISSAATDHRDLVQSGCDSLPMRTGNPKSSKLLDQYFYAPSDDDGIFFTRIRFVGQIGGTFFKFRTRFDELEGLRNHRRHTFHFQSSLNP